MTSGIKNAREKNPTERTELLRKITFLCMAMLVVWAGRSPAVEPLQKPVGRALTHRDVGVYGTLFDFCDFSVYKIRYFSKGRDPAKLAHWRGRLHAAAAQGKKNLVGLYTFDRVKHAHPIPEYIANTDAALDAIDLADVHAVFLSEENVTWSNGLTVLNALYKHIKERFPGLAVYQWLTAPVGPHPKLRADGWVYDFYHPGREAFRRKLMSYLVTGKPFVMCISASPDVARFEELAGERVSQGQVEACREFNIPMFFYCVDLKWGSPAIWLHSEAEEIVPWRKWVLEVVHTARHTDITRLPALSAQYSAGHAIEVAGDKENRFEFFDDFSTARFMTDAAVDGFLNLRWDGLGEHLLFERQAGSKAGVDLYYHFTSDFELHDIRAELTGETLVAGSQTPVQLLLSVTGHNWPHGASTRQTGGPWPGQFSLNASGGDDKAFGGKDFWVRITAAPVPRGRQTPAVVLDKLRVYCAAEPPERRLIELTGDRTGMVHYADNFDSQKYLHLAHITNEEALTWERGLLGTHGVAGRANRVELKWQFVVEKPLAELAVRLKCSANARNLGSVSSVGVSLDGGKPLEEDSTRDKPANRQGTYRGDLILDLAERAELANVKQFWVHATMTNNCGKKTRRSNTIEELEVTGRIGAK